jgi:DNA-binding Lrp family transcriptional regulator
MELGVTSKLVYALLFDRAKISRSNPNYIDDRGRIFVIYTISELAKAIDKSEMTVKSALKALEEIGLIKRKFIGVSKPTHIYILYPDEKLSDRQNTVDKNAHTAQTENHSAQGQKTAISEDGNLSGNNKIYNNKNSLTRESSTSIYRQFSNVILTVDELNDLKQYIPKWQEYIERLSNYMQSTGKTYKNHAATIRQWAIKDNAVINRADYSGGDDDCI